MSSQSIVCASCGSAVPYGRLSCPACGELLASVVGAARPAVAERAPKRATRAARSTAAAPSILVDVEPGDPEPEWPESRPETPSAHPIDATDASDASDASDATDEFGPGGSFAPRSVQPPPAASGAPAASAVAYSSIATAPGAYVPPVVPDIPAGPPAPARAWAGHPAGDAASDAAQPSTSSAGALVDAERLPEFVGWLAVAGSAMAAVGFLLPWGISVIGASGVGYFDRWGLAGPFHPLVVIGLLAVLGLALVRNPIPLWIRVGLAGLGLGALLLGLIWPYLLALRGTGPGVLVVALGAILLGVAGVVALVTDRHATEDRAV